MQRSLSSLTMNKQPGPYHRVLNKAKQNQSRQNNMPIGQSHNHLKQNNQQILSNSKALMNQNNNQMKEIRKPITIEQNQKPSNVQSANQLSDYLSPKKRQASNQRSTDRNDENASPFKSPQAEKQQIKSLSKSTVNLKSLNNPEEGYNFKIVDPVHSLFRDKINQNNLNGTAQFGPKKSEKQKQETKYPITQRQSRNGTLQQRMNRTSTSFIGTNTHNNIINLQTMHDKPTSQQSHTRSISNNKIQKKNNRDSFIRGDNSGTRSRSISQSRNHLAPSQSDNSFINKSQRRTSNINNTTFNINDCSFTSNNELNVIIQQGLIDKSDKIRERTDQVALKLQEKQKLQNKISHLKKELVQTQKQFKNTCNVNQGYIDDIQKLQGLVGKKGTQHSKIGKEIIAIKKEIKTLRDDNEELKRCKSDLQKEIEAERELIDAISQIVSTYKKQIQETMREKKHFAIQIKSAQKNIGLLERKILQQNEDTNKIMHNFQEFMKIE